MDQALDELREWNLPFTRWFVDGELNITVNCLDRHVENGLGDKVAFHWEGEPGDMRTVSFGDLLDDVCRFANGLKSLGLERGDRVVIYMPMIPELPVAMLACARLGLVHSVIFGGFSSDAIRDRVQDASARAIITADGSWRRGKIIPLKQNVDGAVVEGECPSVEHVVVYERCKNEIEMADGARYLVGRSDRGPVGGLSGRAGPGRASAVHPLHQRHDRKTQGSRSRARRLPHPDGVDIQMDLRPQARRHLLV